MKVFIWADKFGESHVVVVEESLEKAKALALEEVIRMYGEFRPCSYHDALDNEPEVHDLPFVTTYHLGD